MCNWEGACARGSVEQGNRPDGCQPIEFLRDSSAPVSIGDCFKGAASDALKKCASLLGIALDLYDSDSPLHGRVESKVKGNSSGGESCGSGDGKPQLRGAAGQILALADALKWDEAALEKELFERFKIAVAPGQLAGALELMAVSEQQMLIQALKAELQRRAQTATKQKGADERSTTRH